MDKSARKSFALICRLPLLKINTGYKSHFYHFPNLLKNDFQAILKLFELSLVTYSLKHVTKVQKSMFLLNVKAFFARLSRTFNSVLSSA